ncbi:uncharacterized protein LOC128873440 [Hylaeus volcanicus]|uniref:uncharacterized protein LOC128873440 n=1 Tax=Hylaeus volcanicus TaxID=313075 RepID=UPI0023B7BFC4|nr:uncharacterized protein LOC128873440 [Hylaeus volcanicus]XP_053973005.1 uncharacterized protein LOC128873440 [Hylaeus volcanicus]
MFDNVTPEKAMAFTKLSVAVNCYWPPPSDATTFQVIRFKFFRYLGMLSTAVHGLPLIYSIYLHRNDTITLTKVICFTCSVLHILSQACFCIAHHERLQVYLEYMADFCAKAQSYEREILQRYVDKYKTFYALSAYWFYVTAILFILGALFGPEEFPIEAEYPFDVKHQPVRTIIFLHQTYFCMQCSAMTCANVFAAMLLIFASAEFEILMVELRAVENVEMLIECIKKYYRVRRDAEEVVDMAQYTTLYTVIMALLPLALCGLNVIGKTPTTVKAQFIFMAGVTLLEVFMCSWPADNMLEVSTNTMQTVYESAWYNQDLKMHKLVLHSLLPQTPVIISFPCIVPVMSLKFFCSYVSNAFTLFTALRVMLND